MFRLSRSGIDPFLLVLAEETRFVRADKIEIGKVEMEMEKKRTEFVDIRNEKVNGSYKILSVKGAGVLDNLTVICDSEFTVNIEIDGDARSYTWSDLQTISEDVSDIAVFQNDLGYVFAMRNISFTSSFSLRVLGDCVIKRAFGKYESYR